MDTKLMYSSHRRYLEVHIIPNFKLQRPSSLVYIGFLSAQGCLQMTLDKDNLLSSLLDEFWPKVSTVSHFNPIKWHPVFLPIQSFKWCHANALLVAIIVRKFS